MAGSAQLLVGGIGRRTQARRHITDAMLREWLDLPSAEDYLRQQRLRWAGHLVRHDTTATRLAFSRMQGARPPGRPRKPWREVIKRDVDKLQLPANDSCAEVAADRQRWKRVIRQPPVT